MKDERDVTQLLQAVAGGDGEAASELYSDVYENLREIAHERLMRYRPGDQLDTTALVHEAYLRLVDQTQVGFTDRAHFFATASQAMRFVIIDHARSRLAQKRGGNQTGVPLDAITVAADERALDLLHLHSALEKLTDRNEELGRLVEYRFFGGLTYEEIAEVTHRSIPTLKRDWQRARTWLYRTMQDEV